MSFFITFEGPDGSGKSTILELVYEELKEEIPLIKTREPGGTYISEKIRDILLDIDHEICPITEALLYAASRSQHVSEKIRPSLEKGITVLCDRYILSSLAYQGMGRELGMEKIQKLNDFATEELEPDLVLFFDIDPITVLKRKKGIEDRLELEKDSFHKRVYEGYLEILEQKKDQENFIRIDASQGIEEVKKDVLSEINKFIKRG